MFYQIHSAIRKRNKKFLIRLYFRIIDGKLSRAHPSATSRIHDQPAITTIDAWIYFFWCMLNYSIQLFLVEIKCLSAWSVVDISQVHAISLGTASKNSFLEPIKYRCFKKILTPISLFPNLINDFDPNYLLSTVNNLSFQLTFFPNHYFVVNFFTFDPF